MRKFITFEVYKLKHPNTGLYHFTKELGHALRETIPHDFSLCYYGRKKDRYIFGADPYREISIWDKIFSPSCSGDTIWHSPYQMSSFMPRKRATKVVVTVHDLNFLYEKNEKKRLKRIAKLQKNIDRADAVVAISEYSKADLLRHIDLKGKEVQVIYNGCNRYSGPIKEPKDIPQKPFLFGVGTILRKKNWHVLPSLLVDNDLMLYVAGTPSAYGDEIMASARKFGVEDRVHLLGEVSEAHKHWYMANCQAFVFPSIAEGFGLPVIEAMYYERPVFLSPHTSLPEVGGDFAYYFPSDFNPSGMREVFERGMADFNLRAQGAQQRAYALGFSWTTAAKKYWEVYKKLLK